MFNLLFFILAALIFCVDSNASETIAPPKLDFQQEILKTVIPALIGGGFAISSIFFNYFINVKYDRAKFKKEKLEKCYLSAFHLHKDIQNLLTAVYESQSQDKEKELVDISEKLSERQGDLLVSSSLWVPEVRKQAWDLSNKYARIIVKVSSFLHETPPSERDDHKIQLLVNDAHLDFMKTYNIFIEKIEIVANKAN